MSTSNTTQQASIGASPYYDDEIDLFELVAGLWRRKWLIAGIAGGAMAIAIVYVLLIATPSFVATAYVRPPVDASLIQINETQVISLSTQDAFERVVFEARSRDTQRQVFEALKTSFLGEWPPAQLTPEEVFVERFAPSFRFTVAGLGKNDVVTESILNIAFEHKNRDFAAEAANTLVTTAESRALASVMDKLKKSLRTKIELLEQNLSQSERTLRENDKDRIARLAEADQLRRLELQDQIAALRNTARQLRQDEITRLEEALAIAESLGIEEPTSLGLLAKERASGGESLTVTADLSGNEEPIYLRGTRILSAELRALEKRQSDDHMYPEIRELQEELALLDANRQIEILASREDYSAFVEKGEEIRAEIAMLEGYLDQDYSDVHLVRIDQKAIPPSRPDKPRKSLIVAAAVVAGGMLGVLIALILNAVESRGRGVAREPAPAA